MFVLVSASLAIGTNYRYSENKHITSRYIGYTDYQYTSNYNAIENHNVTSIW